MNGPITTVGIVAGGGSLPVEVAQSIVARGGKVHIVMVDDVADEALAQYPHTRVNWAQLGRACDAFQRAHVKDVVLLGTYARPEFRTARPDFVFFKVLPAVVRLLRAGGDDAVLRGLIGVLESRGLTVRGVKDVAPELVVPRDALTTRSVSASDQNDIALGLSVIQALGRYDIGQAIVVADGKILAIEGAEGTDRMLARVAAFRGRSQSASGVLIKRPKPGQDLRIDLPAIGPRTAENAKAAGLNGVAVLAGQVLTAERARLIEVANQAGLFIEGVADQVGSEAPISRTDAGVLAVGSVRLRGQVSQAAVRGIEIIDSLAAFSTGSAVVIRNRRVLSVGAAESAVDVIHRVTTKPSAKRSGVVVVAARDQSEDILTAAAQAKLEGVVFPSLPAEPIRKMADKLGLFAAHTSYGGPP